MSFLRDLFCPVKPSPYQGDPENYRVDFSRAAPSSGYSWSNLLYRVVTSPIDVYRRIYNTYLLVRNGELRTPASRNLCPMKWLNPLNSLVFTLHVTHIQGVMKAVLKHPRKDPDGVFDDYENSKAFLPILRDMYPDANVNADDFLMTCHAQYVQTYRQPVLQFLKPENLKTHRTVLQDIVTITLNDWATKSHSGLINATELTFVFTTTAISQLLLGHPGPFDVYRDIASAVNALNKYSVKKVWHHPISEEEKQQYTQALQTLKQAIELSATTTEIPTLGSLVATLRQDKGLTELQIRTTLFLMYFGGSETTASLLNYLLWQLGQHPEYQDEIFNEIEEKQRKPGITIPLYDLATSLSSVDRLFAESIRLFTPAYVIGRQTADNVVCTVTERKSSRVIFQQTIGKKEGILSAPTFAGRDPMLYPNPDTFNPHRFDTPPTSLPWLPFGDGKHSCPGQWLAKLEVQLLVTALVQRFRIHSQPNTEMRQQGYMTLKSSEEVWLSLEQR